MSYENAHLDDVKDDLDYLSDLLGARLSCKTRAERRIASVAEGCRADSRMLRDFLREITVPRNSRAFWRSLKASRMEINSRKDVTELKDRLQGYRSEVLLQVTLLLRLD